MAARGRLWTLGALMLALVAVVAAAAVGAGAAVIDSTSPSVSIAGPSGDISAPVTATITATDNDAVSHLVITLTDADGTRTAADVSGPMATVILDPPRLAGTRVRLRATATDLAGNTATASISWAVIGGATPKPPSLAAARLHLRLRAGTPAPRVARLWLTGLPTGTRADVTLVRAGRADRHRSAVAARSTLELASLVRSVHLVTSTRIIVKITLAGATSRTFTVRRRPPSPPPAAGGGGGGGSIGGGGTG